MDYKLGIAPDDAGAARVAAFTFKGAKGKGTLALQALTLPPLADAESHLGVELTIGSRRYFTSLTFFERKPDRYSAP